jgi:hypothetical protein
VILVGEEGDEEEEELKTLFLVDILVHLEKNNKQG